MSKKHDRDAEWYRKRKIYDDRPLDALLRCSVCKRDDVPASEFNFRSLDDGPARARRYYCRPECRPCKREKAAKYNAAIRSQTCQHSDGCERRVHSNSGGVLLCSWHMRRWQRANGYICEIPTCDRDYDKTQGGMELCRGHAWRMRNWGHPDPERPLKGDRRDLSTVPIALYELSDPAGIPLYYGIGVRPEDRWSWHRRKQPWADLINSERVLVWVQGIEEALRVERELIKRKGGTYHLFNIVHNPQTPRELT